MEEMDIEEKETGKTVELAKYELIEFLQNKKVNEIYCKIQQKIKWIFKQLIYIIEDSYLAKEKKGVEKERIWTKYNHGYCNCGYR